MARPSWQKCYEAPARVGRVAPRRAWQRRQAAADNHGWAADELHPFIAAAKQQLRVRAVTDEELTPFGRASLDAMVAAGIPHGSDLTDLDEDVGVAPNPVNVVERCRWNAAFAYLDPVRGRRLRVIGDALVDRLLLRRDRVIGAAAIIEGRATTIHAGLVAVCAGVYGSPAILLRSGIGGPAALTRLGIRPVHALPGVGRNLHDHPAVELRYAGTPDLKRRSREFAARAFHPEEQLIAKLRSSRCPEEDSFDLHLYTQGGARRHEPSRWMWALTAAVLTPRSRGSLRLRSLAPDAPPIIDHALLSDPDGRDLALLAEAFGHARAVTGQPELAALLGSGVTPGDAVRFPDAVVNSGAQLHGLTGGYVVGASIMPAAPRATTNLPHRRSGRTRGIAACYRRLVRRKRRGECGPVGVGGSASRPIRACPGCGRAVRPLPGVPLRSRYRARRRGHAVATGAPRAAARSYRSEPAAGR